MTFDDSFVSISTRLEVLEGETIVPGRVFVFIEERSIPAIIFLIRETSDV